MIDLRSDSLTQPDAAMRAAMASAEVGDDVYAEDPTVLALQARAAEMLGHEQALFVTSGTQANLIAAMIHARQGDSALFSDTAHTLLYEGGNLGAFAGVMGRPLPSVQGKISAEQVARNTMQIDDPHFSQTRLVVIENTTNLGGGAFYTLDEVRAIAEVCRERGLKFHCDGARLWNGLVASGDSAKDFGAQFDSIYFSLSKGLGCPAGALLCGSAAFIHQARRYRKMLGGGMRQVGVLAAAGLHALDHGYIEALAEDHRRTREFRQALEADGAIFPEPSPTNIAYIHVPNAFFKIPELYQRGVRVLPRDPEHLRVMFHRDITDEGLTNAIAAFREVL